MAIIDKPSSFFLTQIYSGNSFSGRELKGFGFNPDMAWIKRRDNNRSHFISDSVRGGNKQLKPNLTGAETTATGYIQSFIADGFTLGSDGDSNASGGTYVAWAWRASGSTVSNSEGSITSTVSVNETSGCSISTYAGTGGGKTFGHGLGVAPKMFIIKNRSSGDYNWAVWHASLANPATGRLSFTTAATNNNSAYWNNTAPTSTLISLGSDAGGNTNGNNYVCWAFSEKQGYSKMGKYTGNGDANGAFVTTSFRPAFIMLKAVAGTEDWRMYDNKRVGFNSSNFTLYANLNNVEATDIDLDILSNGFKCRRNSGGFNNSGSQYIYIAFAENPFVTSRANGSVPATAR